MLLWEAFGMSSFMRFDNFASCPFDIVEKHKLLNDFVRPVFSDTAKVVPDQQATRSALRHNPQLRLAV
jgi:hypothetical protein